jgi:hypothetical protein
MLPQWLIRALLALTALVVLAAPAPAEVVFPPGLRVGLQPPPGMRMNDTTHRFEDPDREASITVLDLPLQLYSEMEKMVFAETNGPGVTVLKRESFPFASGIGYYAAVRLSIDGKSYRKWILLASSAASPVPDLAALISVQVPDDASDAYPDNVVRTALASVTFRPPPIDERLGLVPFVISDFGGFKVTQVAPNGVVLNESAEIRDLPRIVISVGSGGPANADDRARFARDLFQTLALRDLDIISAEPLRIRGRSGFEIKARAKDLAGAEITLVQWLRFDGGGYLMVIAGARNEDWERVYPRFRAVRDAIEPR